LKRTALLALALACCRPPPVENPEPTLQETTQEIPEAQDILSLKWNEAWNLHSEFGASGSRLFSDVTLYLLEGGKVRVDDTGSLSDSHLDKTFGYEEETTTWNNVWQGTYVQKDDTLVLEIEPTERTCEKVETDPQGQETRTPCPELPRKVRLECSEAEISLMYTDEVREAWLCLPTGSADLGGTPSPWVFGKLACLQTLGGKFSPLEYEPCEE
jgi:hypothetical protein